jgi:hypothetical protein
MELALRHPDIHYSEYLGEIIGSDQKTCRLSDLHERTEITIQSGLTLAQLRVLRLRFWRFREHRGHPPPLHLNPIRVQHSEPFTMQTMNELKMNGECPLSPAAHHRTFLGICPGFDYTATSPQPD